MALDFFMNCLGIAYGCSWIVSICLYQMTERAVVATGIAWYIDVFIVLR